MHPTVALVTDDLRANARAWMIRARLPLRAVVKSDGYGWGGTTLVAALDGIVAGYYVNDAAEFVALRPHTTLPIATLASIGPTGVPAILDAAGIPTVSTPEAIEVAGTWSARSGKPARVRVAVANATGWSGMPSDEIVRLAAPLVRARLDVEFSSHITDASLLDEQLAAFLDARTRLQAAGVPVVASDLASTAPLARDLDAGCSHVRIGIGLFGPRFGADVDAVCALRVRAPIISADIASAQRTGYGTFRAPTSGYVAVVRCGYGDGFPSIRDEATGVLAVGMQFTTVHSPRPFTDDVVELIGRTTNLDDLARAAHLGPHQVIVTLGLAARALGYA